MQVEIQKPRKEENFEQNGSKEFAEQHDKEPVEQV